MTNQEIYAAAKHYVDIQLATMQKFGSAPTLSTAEYDGLIEDIIDVTIRLRKRYVLPCNVGTTRTG
jgi:hypothetical protein